MLIAPLISKWRKGRKIKGVFPPMVRDSMMAGGDKHRRLQRADLPAGGKAIGSSDAGGHPAARRASAERLVAGRGLLCPTKEHPPPCGDRKSGGEGKSVDLGG